eukprot:s470_g22.t1
MPGVSGHEVRDPDAAHACPTSDVCCRDGCQINQNTAQHYRPSFVHAPFATTSQPRKEQLKRRVRGRVREHTEVINDAQRSIKDIEEAITQVEGCQTRLVHMRYARFADLKVCEKRLQLRERRPPRENFRDAVEEALDRERGVLERSRQDLLSLEAEAQQFLTDLQDALHGIGMLRAFRRAVDQAMRAELSRDTGARRLQVESELAQMRMATGASVSLPEVDNKNTQPHQVIKLLSEEEAKSLKQRSIAVIRKARELPDRADVMLARIRQDRTGNRRKPPKLSSAPTELPASTGAQGTDGTGTGTARAKAAQLFRISVLPVLSLRLAVKTRELGEFDPWR